MKLARKISFVGVAALLLFGLLFFFARWVKKEESANSNAQIHTRTATPAVTSEPEPTELPTETVEEILATIPALAPALQDGSPLTAMETELKLLLDPAEFPQISDVWAYDPTSYDYLDYFALSSLTYGSFTAAEADEVLAEFTYTQSYTAIGADRKIIAIYDVPSGALVLSFSFGDEWVGVYPLSGENENPQEYVLCIGASAGKGAAHGSAILYQLTDGEVTTCTLPDTGDAERVLYSFSTATQTLTLTDYTGVYFTEDCTVTPATMGSYLWDADTGSFVAAE